MRLTNGAPGLLYTSQAAPGQYNGLRIRVFGDKGSLDWDQEKPEFLRFVPFGEQEQIIVRGMAAGVFPEAEQLIELPRGIGEATTDAWANLYADAGFAVAAKVSGEPLEDSVQGRISGAEDGLRGMLFIEACADSHEANGTWTKVRAVS